MKGRAGLERGPTLEALLLEDTTYLPDADCELEERSDWSVEEPSDPRGFCTTELANQETKIPVSFPLQDYRIIVEKKFVRSNGPELCWRECKFLEVPLGQ
jgi:hypothetical protein